MIVEKLSPGLFVFADYNLSGTTLTVGTVEVDLEAEQQESEVVVTISRSGGEYRRGWTPDCELTADIVIPRRRYDISDDGGEEGGSGTYMPLPVDVDAVLLRLWPSAATDEEMVNNIQGGAGNGD